MAASVFALGVCGAAAAAVPSLGHSLGCVACGCIASPCFECMFLCVFRQCAVLCGAVSVCTHVSGTPCADVREERSLPLHSCSLSRFFFSSPLSGLFRVSALCAAVLHAAVTPLSTVALCCFTLCYVTFIWRFVCVAMIDFTLRHTFDHSSV